MAARKSISASSRATKVICELADAQGKDLSGSEFVGVVLNRRNCFESIFNGCVFTGVHANQSIFQHAEFTETTFRNCTFEDSSFDHSDFVLASFSNCRFARCSFQNAEWRQSEFSSSVFEQCIFRNTTTSLVQFLACHFDDPSSLNFIGNSKRYSLFSGGSFHLPHSEVAFLRTNFGLVADASENVAGLEPVNDPLFQISRERYHRALTPLNLYRLALRAISDLGGNDANPMLLRFQYVTGICRLLLHEDFFSVFSIKALEKALSEEASRLRSQDQMLELFNILLTFRLGLRQRVNAIEDELTKCPSRPSLALKVFLEFEETFSRPQIDEYLALLAQYCAIANSSIDLRRFEQGSTFVEFVLGSKTLLVEVLRFLKYSMPIVTCTLKEAGKSRKAFAELKSPKPELVRRAKKQRRRQSRTETLSQSVVSEITGTNLQESAQIEVFVDKAKERVLVVGGKVKVTILLS